MSLSRSLWKRSRSSPASWIRRRTSPAGRVLSSWRRLNLSRAVNRSRISDRFVLGSDFQFGLAVEPNRSIAQQGSENPVDLKFEQVCFPVAAFGVLFSNRSPQVLHRQRVLSKFLDHLVSRDDR